MFLKNEGGYILLENLIASFIFIILLFSINLFSKNFFYTNKYIKKDILNYEYIINKIFYSISLRDVGFNDILISENRIEFIKDGEKIQLNVKNGKLYYLNKKIFEADKIIFSKENGKLKMYIFDKNRVSERVLSL